jgi:hypothetical protein
VRIIYRTFSELFRHVVVFSAEDLSSDTVLIGSDSPLPLDIGRISRAFALPRVAPELERAYIHSPEDVLARVLLASKSEVARFTGNAPLNTDDNARIELAAPRDLIGFERYKGYLETMYAADWPYGRVMPHLTGFGTGTAAAERKVRLALALLAHGRKREVPALLDQAAAESVTPGAEGEPPTSASVQAELDIARALHRLLSTTHDEPVLTLALEPVPSDATPELRTRVDETRTAVLASLAAGQRANAIRRLESIPAALRRKLGSGWSLFEAHVRYKSGDVEGCIDGLEELLRNDDEIGLRQPELFYFLARSHDAMLHFDKAVRNMRVYVLARGPRAAAETPVRDPF